MHETRKDLAGHLHEQSPRELLYETIELSVAAPPMHGLPIRGALVLLPRESVAGRCAKAKLLPERKPLVRHAWTVTKTTDGVRVKPAASSIPPSALSFLAWARAQRRAVETRTSSKCMQHSSGALANDAVEVTSSEASDLMMQPQGRYISDQECLLHSAEQGPLGDDSHYYLAPLASCTPGTKCGATDRLLATNNIVLILSSVFRLVGEAAWHPCQKLSLSLCRSRRATPPLTAKVPA